MNTLFPRKVQNIAKELATWPWLRSTNHCTHSSSTPPGSEEGCTDWRPTFQSLGQNRTKVAPATRSESTGRKNLEAAQNLSKERHSVCTRKNTESCRVLGGCFKHKKVLSPLWSLKLSQFPCPNSPSFEGTSIKAKLYVSHVNYIMPVNQHMHMQI